MINSITGEVTFKDAECIRIAVKGTGIEWELPSSLKSIGRLPAVGETVVVYTFLYHREDQLKLFGFASTAERELFVDLLKVEGLGPRLALRILSGIDVAEFVQALESDDVETLSSVPGLGKKTAQKIILKLKGKLTSTSESSVSIETEIVEALAGMGFEKRAAREAVRQALKELGGTPSSGDQAEREVVRRAIEIAGRRES